MNPIEIQDNIGEPSIGTALLTGLQELTTSLVWKIRYWG